MSKSAAETTFRAVVDALTEYEAEMMRQADAFIVIASQVNSLTTVTRKEITALEAKGVDSDTRSEAASLAKGIDAITGKMSEFVSAAAVVSKQAGTAAKVAHDLHGGIKQAYDRTKVDVSNLKSEWLQQE